MAVFIWPTFLSEGRLSDDVKSGHISDSSSDWEDESKSPDAIINQPSEHTPPDALWVHTPATTTGSLLVPWLPVIQPTNSVTGLAVMLRTGVSSPSSRFVLTGNVFLIANWQWRGETGAWLPALNARLTVWNLSDYFVMSWGASDCRRREESDLFKNKIWKAWRMAIKLEWTERG